MTMISFVTWSKVCIIFTPFKKKKGKENCSQISESKNLNTEIYIGDFFFLQHAFYLHHNEDLQQG